MPNHLYTGFLRLPLFIRIALIAIMVMFLFGVLIHLLEPNTFTTPFEGIWWAVITASTVGYGDFVPQTFLGKLTGIILILLGAGFVSSYFVTLATTAVTKQNAFLEGKMTYKGKNHLIIIGWNERSKEIIHNLGQRNTQILLIDETLESNPSPYRNVHFIKGRSNLDEVLIKANIFESSNVLITADQNKDELQADMHTILTLLAVKGLNPSIYCIVEVLTTEQMANAKRAGADEIIQSNTLTSFTMLNSLSSHGISHSLLEMLVELKGTRLVYQHAPEEVIGKNFIDASSILLKQGTLAVGIKQGEETIVNPPQDLLISNEDYLLILNCEEHPTL